MYASVAYRRVFHDDLVDLRTDHRRVLARLRVVEVVEVVHRRRELLLRLLVQIGDGDSCSEDSEIRMAGSHRGSNFSSQVVQLNGADALVDAADHFDGDFDLNAHIQELILQSSSYRVDVVHVETVAELLDARGDLVEKDVLFSSV